MSFLVAKHFSQQSFISFLKTANSYFSMILKYFLSFKHYLLSWLHLQLIKTINYPSFTFLDYQLMLIFSNSKVYFRQEAGFEYQFTVILFFEFHLINSFNFELFTKLQTSIFLHWHAPLIFFLHFNQQLLIKAFWICYLTLLKKNHSMRTVY